MPEFLKIWLHPLGKFLAIAIAVISKRITDRHFSEGNEFHLQMQNCVAILELQLSSVTDTDCGLETSEFYNNFGYNSRRFWCVCAQDRVSHLYPRDLPVLKIVRRVNSVRKEKFTTAVAKHYGKSSEMLGFPEEKEQENTTDSKTLRQ